MSHDNLFQLPGRPQPNVHRVKKSPQVYDIIMIRGDGTYSWIFLKSGEQIFTSRTIKYWMQRFNSNHLLRVHRSFAVHLDHISRLESEPMTLQLTGGLNATIARSKRKVVRKLFEKAS